MEISRSLAVLTFFCGALQAAPSLVVTAPMSTDGWLVAPESKPFSQSLQLAFQATETAPTSASLYAGVMAEGQCRSMAPTIPPTPIVLPAGLIVGQGQTGYAVIRPNTPPNPSADPLTKVLLPVAVKKAVKTPVLELCAYDPLTNSLVTVPLKISNGQPVKAVTVQQADYAPEQRVLSVRGIANPTGKNALNGSAAVVLNESGQELGRGLVVSPNKFSFTVPLAVNPGRVRVQVVNTVSKPRPVKVR